MGTNSNPKGEGVNSVTPLGASQASSNAQQGIDARIAKGTVGSRPNMGAGKYGGDPDSGSLFKGASAGPSSSRESNSGNNEKASNNTGQYGNDKKIERGGVGSREQMPKYGSESNVGNLLGVGAGATKDASPTDQLQRDLPKMPGLDLLKGTSAGDMNMAKAKRGIGTGKTKG